MHMRGTGVPQLGSVPPSPPHVDEAPPSPPHVDEVLPASTSLATPIIWHWSMVGGLEARMASEEGCSEEECGEGVCGEGHVKVGGGCHEDGGPNLWTSSSPAPLPFPPSSPARDPVSPTPNAKYAISVAPPLCSVALALALYNQTLKSIPILHCLVLLVTVLTPAYLDHHRGRAAANTTELLDLLASAATQEEGSPNPASSCSIHHHSTPLVCGVGQPRPGFEPSGGSCAASLKVMVVGVASVTFGVLVLQASLSACACPPKGFRHSGRAR